jgi:hypothetical protein
MLRLAIEAGYPSVRLWLRAHGGITWREHRRLTDLLSIEPVGAERTDWHFARLMQLLYALLAKREDDEDLPPLDEWLLDRLIYEPPEVIDEEADYERFVAAMRAFAARGGIEERTVPLA